MALFLCLGRKLILVNPAQGAQEILGQILKFGAGGDAAGGVAACLIVNPFANVTYVFHVAFSPFVFGASPPKSVADFLGYYPLKMKKMTRDFAGWTLHFMGGQKMLKN